MKAQQLFLPASPNSPTLQYLTHFQSSSSEEIREVPSAISRNLGIQTLYIYWCEIIQVFIIILKITILWNNVLYHRNKIWTFTREGELNSRSFPISQNDCSLNCESHLYVCISGNFQKPLFYVWLCQFISLAIFPSISSEFLGNSVDSLGKVCVVVAEVPGYFMGKFFSSGGYWIWKIPMFTSAASHTINGLNFKGNFTVIFLWIIFGNQIKWRVREALKS